MGPTEQAIYDRNEEIKKLLLKVKMTERNIQDTNYADFHSIAEYVSEPYRIGFIKAAMRAKRQMIQMLEREHMELEETLQTEINFKNSNNGKWREGLE